MISLFTAEASIQHTTARKESLKGLYSNFVLWDCYTQTLLGCTVQCASDSRCLAYSFLKYSPEKLKLCRGYFGGVSSLINSSLTLEEEAFLYQVSARGHEDMGTPTTQGPSDNITSRHEGSTSSPQDTATPEDMTSKTTEHREEISTQLSDASTVVEVPSETTEQTEEISTKLQAQNTSSALEMTSEQQEEMTTTLSTKEMTVSLEMISETTKHQEEIHTATESLTTEAQSVATTGGPLSTSDWPGKVGEIFTY